MNRLGAEMKLTERNYVKDLAGIARADTLKDPRISAGIEAVSLSVQTHCQREFEKMERTEYAPRHELTVAEQEPHIVFLKAYPVDPMEPFSIFWNDSANELGAEPTEIPATSYTVDYERGRVYIANLGSYTQLPVFDYRVKSDRGFKIVYTGGYAASEHPGGDPDPLDDYDVIQVPDSLKFMVAEKVANYVMDKDGLTLSDNDRALLYPWKRKDGI